MKRGYMIFVSIVLFIIVWSYSVFSNVSGKQLSISYKLEKDCTIQKDINNEIFPDYYRSSCFKKESKYYYHICDEKEECLVSNINISNDNPYTEKIRERLGASIFLKIDKVVLSFKKIETEKLKKVSLHFSKIGEKYAKSDLIQNIIWYLQFEIKKIIQNRWEDIDDDFLCILWWNCGKKCPTYALPAFTPKWCNYIKEVNSEGCFVPKLVCEEEEEEFIYLDGTTRWVNLVTYIPEWVIEDSLMENALVLDERYFFTEDEIAADGIPHNKVDAIRKAIKNYPNKHVIIDIEKWDLSEGAQKYADTIDLFKMPWKYISQYWAGPSEYWPVQYKRVGNDQRELLDVERYNAWKERSKKMKIILDTAYASYPSFYTFYGEWKNNEIWVGIEWWKSFVIENIKESRRLNPGKKVIPFLWPRWHDSDPEKAWTYIPDEYWLEELRIVREHADGMIIWDWHQDKEWDARDKHWYKILKKFVEEDRKK